MPTERIKGSRDFVEKQVSGPIVLYVYTVEFQKRGFLHAHILKKGRMPGGKVPTGYLKKKMI